MLETNYSIVAFIAKTKVKSMNYDNKIIQN